MARVYMANTRYPSSRIHSSTSKARALAVEPELIVADEEASMARAATGGGKVAQAEDRPAWEAGARQVWTSFAPRLGGLPRIEAIAASA